MRIRDLGLARVMDINSVQVPTFFYGTAWKEEATEGLTDQALQAGFLGIDTANQRKHYFEEAVGKAVIRHIQTGYTKRSQLFLQTKFTYKESQDERIPYDIHADYSTQVRQSFASSLEHFQTDFIDSYVLHGPLRREGLAKGDWEVWRIMEELYGQGKIRLLGVSNVSHTQLQELLDGAKVAPTFVQNRCYARLGWDAAVRKICYQHGVIYQGFSLLTANRKEMKDKRLHDIASRVHRTPVQVVFRFAMHRGMLPLTGTTDPKHMKEDLSVYDFSLTEDDLNVIEKLSF